MIEGLFVVLAGLVVLIGIGLLGVLLDGSSEVHNQFEPMSWEFKPNPDFKCSYCQAKQPIENTTCSQCGAPL